MPAEEASAARARAEMLVAASTAAIPRYPGCRRIMFVPFCEGRVVGCSDGNVVVVRAHGVVGGLGSGGSGGSLGIACGAVEQPERRPADLPARAGDAVLLVGRALHRAFDFNEGAYVEEFREVLGGAIPEHD